MNTTGERKLLSILAPLTLLLAAATSCLYIYFFVHWNQTAYAAAVVLLALEVLFLGFCAARQAGERTGKSVGRGFVAVAVYLAASLPAVYLLNNVFMLGNKTAILVGCCISTAILLTLYLLRLKAYGRKTGKKQGAQKLPVALFICIPAMFLLLAPSFPFYSGVLFLQASLRQGAVEDARALKLWYDEPADAASLKLTEDACWERRSLPLGNGHMGMCVFGRTDTERLQLTENTLCNPTELGGLNNFAEVYIDFSHGRVKNYSRDLCLDSATAHVSYQADGVEYLREYFTSYPDNVAVVRLTASQLGKISFTLRPTIPYTKEYAKTPGDGAGKSGSVTADGDTLVLSGNMHFYDIDFEGQLRVLHEGGSLRVQADENGENASLTLTNADSATILITVGTNYKMESRVFTEADPKRKLAPYAHPHEKVTTLMNNAARAGFEKLRAAHIADYKALFGRVQLDFGGRAAALTTDKLLHMYRAISMGTAARYLEQLYFQYGRYLLISSSRKGTPPANLQGVWNVYDDAPWGAGYFHNINVQMNYWPAFPVNLAETFTAYADYNSAYMELAREKADAYILENYPSLYAGKGNNGWIIGAVGWLYTISGAPKKGTSSGPGTGALTAMLLWDWYEFTADTKLLRERIYPALYEMSVFLSKNLIEDENGNLLCRNSASPEQEQDGHYVETLGCAFDQQMIWESFHHTIAAAQLLGESDDPFIAQITEEITHLDPVQIGDSGQVKEFREEVRYGDIGEYNHRHISHLVGLYPGTLITKHTPEWLNAAKVTLNERGDESTGWAMAHRLCLWARTGDGERAHTLLRKLLSKGTLDNLWDTHPPFQIDGNFGGVAGIADMLLQSRAGYIAFIPALPKAWKTGSFSGLVARGNFEISLDWSDAQANRAEILSRAGGECAIRVADARFRLTDANGETEGVLRDGILRFDTVRGEAYTIIFE